MKRNIIYPKQLNITPIAEAIIEIRFVSGLPSAAIFGTLYNQFKDQYPEIKQLPILNLPINIREQEESLKYQPHYHLVSENFLIQIGSSVISINSVDKYLGWNSYTKKIDEFLDLIENSGLVEKCLRIGVRYINVFETNIYDGLNLKLVLNDDKFEAIQNNIRSTYMRGDYLVNINIVNDARLSPDLNAKKVSVFDIDVYKDMDDEFIKTRVREIIDSEHSIEKEVFFGFLTEEFISNYEPTY
ncbi:MAG: TIGR04255 family protein [Chlorobiaceae bacterium]|nr:TIGR04255 family protein [Chlorobiaceae bacterium]